MGNGSGAAAFQFSLDNVIPDESGVEPGAVIGE